MGNKIVIERTLNAPTEKVWQALTDGKQLKKWLPFFPEFKAEVGFETRFSLGRDKDHQYLHICKVLEVVDGKKLVYTWRYDGIAGNSSITFELSDDGGNTKLTLTQEVTEPFPADNPDFAQESAKEGWNYTADALKQFVESN
jgi:uncharacterized protein YndB with AHSA1/START domain